MPHATKIALAGIVIMLAGAFTPASAHGSAVPAHTLRSGSLLSMPFAWSFCRYPVPL